MDRALSLVSVSRPRVALDFGALQSLDGYPRQHQNSKRGIISYEDA